MLTWSGLDTLSARDAYLERPTEAGFNDGASREVRTNALVAATATLGLATAAVGAFLTEWSGGSSERAGLRAVPSVALGDGRAQVTVIGSF